MEPHHDAQHALSHYLICHNSIYHTIGSMASLRCTIAQPLHTQRHSSTRCLIARPPAVSRAKFHHIARPCMSRSIHNMTVRAAAVGAAAGDVQGDMLVPSAANKNWVRALALTAAVAATARGVGFLPAQGVAFVHLLALASWLGSTVWVTFIAGLTMFKNMPRQMFGKVQAKLFPMYFALHAASALVILGCHVWGGMGVSGAAKVVLTSLSTALGASLLNLLVLEPKATAVMFERCVVLASRCFCGAQPPSPTGTRWKTRLCETRRRSRGSSKSLASFMVFHPWSTWWAWQLACRMCGGSQVA